MKLSTLKDKAKPITFLLGGIVSCICLYLAFRKVDWKEFVTGLATMDWKMVAVGFILVNLHNFLMAKRWHILVDSLVPISYWQAFWSLRISYFFNASLPARLGEPFRIYYLKRCSDLSVAKAIGAMGADRLLDFFTLLLLLYVSAWVLGMRGTLPATETIITATIIATSIVGLIFVIPNRSRFKWLKAVLDFKTTMFQGVAPLVKLRVLMPTIPLSLIGWIIEAVIIVSFSYGVGAPISLFKAFMVIAAITVAISIPASPGHLGTFELAAISMLQFLGMNTEQAAKVAILYHMLQLLTTLLVGAYGYHIHFVHLKNPKKGKLADLKPLFQQKNRDDGVASVKRTKI